MIWQILTGIFFLTTIIFWFSARKYEGDYLWTLENFRIYKRQAKESIIKLQKENEL